MLRYMALDLVRVIYGVIARRLYIRTEGFSALGLREELGFMESFLRFYALGSGRYSGLPGAV